MHSKDSNPATATLQQIYTNIEEGVLDPSGLDAAAARDLLSRVMLAGDDELLLMLVEAGMGSALSPVCLQQLLQYAMLEELPWLAQLVVQSTDVELTPEVSTGAWCRHISACEQCHASCQLLVHAKM
jgi:hypothetical protein